MLRETMVLKIFTKPDCPKCPPAKKLAKSLQGWPNGLPWSGELKIEKHDVSTVDGMVEGAFYSVMSTPSLILVDDKGKIVAEWRGEVPNKKEILAKLQ